MKIFITEDIHYKEEIFKLKNIIKFYNIQCNAFLIIYIHLITFVQVIEYLILFGFWKINI